MKFGVVLYPHRRVWQTVQRAEALGYSHAWLGDSPMCWSDVYISMALAAEHTSKIVLGTGVTVPRNRTAPVVASAAATLNALAPGRIVIGVGSGFSARRAMGLKAVPMDEMRNFVDVCSKLTAGEAAWYEEDGQRRKVAFLHADRDEFFCCEPRVPIYVAAFGPKALNIAGELGDGYITFSLQSPKRLAKTLDAVRAAAAAKGRDPGAIDCVLMAGGFVLRDGESAGDARVVAAAGPFVVSVWHDYLERDVDPDEVSAVERDAYAGYRKFFAETNRDQEAPYLELHRGHATFLRPGEEKFVTAALIERFCMIGRGPELIAKIRDLEAVGVRQIAFTISPDQDYLVERFAEDVVQKY